jgi:2-desacetyl-2-hydroxyethyl bacteriochlorophyllide A dehydrogenase
VRALVFQAPGDVAVVEKPEPELREADDAIVQVETTGICGSDLHIFHGRVKIEAGFTIGHEFVGTVVAAGSAVTRVEPGDRVLGCFCTACGSCPYCLRGDFHKCDAGRAFGHGAALGDLPGSHAEFVLVPRANLVLRKVPADMPSEVALFAGDVMGTGYHAVAQAALRVGDTCAVLGLGPVGLCAVQVAKAAGASRVFAVDTVPSRLALAERLGANPVHLVEGDPRAVVKEATGGHGVDVSIEAVGDARALDLAARLTRKCGTVSVVGVHAERAEVHLGMMWMKALTVRMGSANVIGHVDRVIAMLQTGLLDPRPLVTHRMKLDDAPEAFNLYARREALKIVLHP